jgi:ADP-ribosylglycohydrolase
MDFYSQQAANLWQEAMTNSKTIENRIIEAIDAQEMLGYDVSEARKLVPHGWDAYKQGDYWRLQKIIAMIWAALRRAPKLRLDEYKPDTWEQLQRSWTAIEHPTGYDVSECNPEFRKKVLGAWYGKCIGVSLGDPMAGWPTEKVRKERGYITDYVQKPDTRNDDINYQLIVLHCVEEFGPKFTSEQLGFEWVEHLNPDKTYTAERQAIDNLRRGLVPPYSARDINPFSDWIGGQMRGEVHGLLAPGRPALAAELSYRDAIIAHVKEGVYGEIFNSVMVSLAFIMDDIEEIITTALGYVPANSEFASIVRSTLSKCKEHDNWEDVIDWINETYGHYHWIHTFPNIAIVVMSLMYGNGDFSKSIQISASCGWDCDCTTGQVGATVGALVGIDNIPKRWKEPLADTLETDVHGYTTIEIPKLADWTCHLARKIVKHYG